jgi:hypothetical protein
MFENNMLKTIFAPKREEVKGGWIDLHNEVFHSSYSSPIIIIIVVVVIKEDDMNGTCYMLGAYRILIGKYEEKR